MQELADKKNKIKPSQTPSLFDDVNNNSENSKMSEAELSEFENEQNIGSTSNNSENKNSVNPKIQ